MSAETVTLRVPAEQDGERLDRFLASSMNDLTRSALRRIIVAGRVTVDGESPPKAGVLLKAGTEVVVALPDPEPDALLPEAIPIDVVHEDEHLIVVVKPAGMLVHPARGNPGGTLLNALLGRGVRLAPAGGNKRPGVVHRLDRDTSGLLLVAKTDLAHRAMARAFARREVRKTYHALVWGRPRPAEGTIERSIGRSRSNPTRMAVEGARGKRQARSVFRTLESMPGFALLEVRPVTGRTHQIRVHLKSIHHPVVGDSQYGEQGSRGVQDPLKRKALRNFRRLALHAYRLSLVHPVEGRELNFHAPRPAEFEELLGVLRASP